ncbi:MAG TPA: DUF6220 domain-containing protein [Candidatus Binatia bacterium]|nr:DUF6220 domain-containing protein [Candidatus Binatia bacterium]
MVRAARYAYVALAWAFVAAIVVQVFLIGLGIFVDPRNRELHATVGWLLHLAPLPILVAAAAAAAGRAQILQALALTVTIFFVPILAAIRADAPLAAAFHPVGALLAFWLATVVARGATRLVATRDEGARTPIWAWVVVVLVVAIVLGVSLTGSPSAA